MKKFASVLLTLVMLLSLATTAFAAENTTISVKSGDTRTYKVYQIFTGDLSDDGTLANIKWGLNGTGTTGATVPEATLNTLAGLANSSDAAKLAEIEKLVDLTGDPIGTVSAGTPLTVPTGYYIIVDQGEVGEGESYSLNLVEVVGPTTIIPKVGEITSEKKVDDKNDSNTSEDAVVWQDSADYDIGDAVPFQLKATLPDNYDDYTTYYLCFHDTEAAGLTFNAASVVVKVNGTAITTGYEVKTSCTDGCTFEVVFTNLKTVKTAAKNSVITVEYTSTLNDNAVIGSAGNENTMHLEYSNNPNGEGKGETPDDTVIVFTYQVIVNKVDQNIKPLTGAGFTLYKKDASGNWNAIGSEIKGNDMTKFTWKGLDDGDYKLVESTTPKGYNTMADLEFTITATHSVVWTKGNGSALTALDGGDLGTGIVSTGTITDDIVNNKGTTLPETGAAGTMMFITIGSLLAIAAAVFMITRKKMSIYED